LVRVRDWLDERLGRWDMHVDPRDQTIRYCFRDEADAPSAAALFRSARRDEAQRRVVAVSRRSEVAHQIMLPADECLGQQYSVIAEFCADLSCPCVREATRSSYQIGGRVFCFAERADTEEFQARFGGVWFDPAHRGRGNSWMRIKPPKQKFY
jgi:hypothetical protein